MILSCPACATRYTLDEAQLGPGGRTVRCAACRTTWHAEAAAPLIELPLTTPVRERVEDLQSVKAEKLPLKYRAMVEDQKRTKALAAQGIVWGVMAAAMLAVLALAYLLRVDIVRTFPRIAGAYAMVGIEAYGTNLKFGAQDAQRMVKGGRFVVTVKAQIRNASHRPTPVPPVRVRLNDATQAEFSSLLVPSNGLIVPAGATRTLVFDVSDPGNMTSSVDLRFDLEAMKSGKARAGQRSWDKVAALRPTSHAPPASEGDSLAEAALPENAGAPADRDISAPRMADLQPGLSRTKDGSETAAAPKAPDVQPAPALRLRPSRS